VRNIRSKDNSPKGSRLTGFPTAFVLLVTLILILPALDLILGLNLPAITGFGMFLGGLGLLALGGKWVSAHWARRMRKVLIADGKIRIAELANLHDASRKPARLFVVWLTDEGIAIRNRDLDYCLLWGEIESIEVQTSSMLQVKTIHLQTRRQGLLEIELLRDDGVFVANQYSPEHFADEIRLRALPMDTPQ
jgi:hypothetical protein